MWLTGYTILHMVIGSWCRQAVVCVIFHGNKKSEKSGNVRKTRKTNIVENGSCLRTVKWQPRDYYHNCQLLVVEPLSRSADNSRADEVELSESYPAVPLSSRMDDKESIGFKLCPLDGVCIFVTECRRHPP